MKTNLTINNFISQQCATLHYYFTRYKITSKERKKIISKIRKNKLMTDYDINSLQSYLYDN